MLILVLLVFKFLVMIVPIKKVYNDFWVYIVGDTTTEWETTLRGIGRNTKQIVDGRGFTWSVSYYHHNNGIKTFQMSLYKKDEIEFYKKHNWATTLNAKLVLDPDTENVYFKRALQGNII